MRVRQSISRQLVSMQVYTVLLVLTICTFVFLGNEVLMIHHELNRRLSAISRILGRNLEAPLSFLDTREANRILSYLESEKVIATAVLIDNKKAVFATYGPAPSNSNQLESLPLEEGMRVNDFKASYSYPISTQSDHLGNLYLELNLRTVFSESLSYVWLTILVYILGAAIAVLVARRTQARLALPITELAETAKKISHQRDYKIRVSIPDDHETFEEAATLLKEFNSMLEALEKSTYEHATLLSNEKAAKESSRLKSEFLAKMSHEVRTPINGVLGLTDFLLETQLTDDQKNHAQAIKTSTQALLTLINDILDFSKIESGNLKIDLHVFDLINLFEDLERIFRLLVDRSKVSFKLEMDPKIGRHFKGDSSRIKQIAMNLLNNAVKFTEKGQIKIALIQTEETETESTILFEISDSGIGISTENLKKLFQPFVQSDNSMSRKYGGTGLGLSICKNLAELLGGEIGARSVEGEGSVFWFKLKLLKATESIKKENKKFVPEIDREVARNFRILLAEDNLINQTLAVTYLTRLGFKVDTAMTGLEVLKRLGSSHYDLILMDCQMPEMDGYTTSTRIRESDNLPKSIPIVALTAHALAGDREKCLEAGMSDYLTKPLSKDDLKIILDKWLISGREQVKGSPGS